MDVNGKQGNVWAFRFACSSAFSPIEQEIGNPNGTIGSVTMGIGERIIKGETPELFYSNGQIVYKIKDKDDLILLLDPTTGIVRDVANGITGAYCYHNQITNRRIELAQNLTSNDPNVQPEFPLLISSVSLNIAKEIPEIIGPIVESLIAVGGTISFEAVMTVAGPILLVAAPIALLEVMRPQMIEQAESEGNFNTAEWWRQSFMDRWKDALYFIIFQSGGWSDVLNEQNAYINRINQPLYEQRDLEWQEFYDNFWGGINFLMENGDDRQTTLPEFWMQQAIDNMGVGGASGGPDEWSEVIKNICIEIRNNVIDVYEGIQAGDPVAIVKGGVGFGGGVLLLFTVVRGISFDIIEESYQKYMQFSGNSTSGSSGGGGGGVIP
nr:hypothetical protein [uncultured Methanobacterium sp.]